MRRVSLALLVALTACANFKETFTARRDTAAEAGSLKLAPDTLARILAAPRGIRLTKDAANFVANLWVDYALFAQAAVAGKLPRDSASAAKALWPEVAELRTQHWHDSIAAKREQPSAAVIDSVYNGSELRVFQHILIGAPQAAKPEQKAAAKKKAEATLAKLKGGADFGQLATQVSDDPGSKADGGFLPPSPRGRFVPTFDSAGWRLTPGAMTGLVESPFGYHIIKRPAEAAVQPRLAAYLGQLNAGKADSAYMEALGKTNQLDIAKSAAADMRAATLNPEASKGSSKRLTSFKNGELTVGEYLRWVRALPPQYDAQLKQANDTVLAQFAKVLSLNLLLLRQADSAKVALTEAEWKMLFDRYTGGIDSLRGDMGVSATDSAKDAQQVVNGYFDRLASGKQRLRPMPGALGTLLREQGRYRISDPGVSRALELALAQQVKRDSATPPAGPRLQPAPGGPPVPGSAAPAPAPGPAHDSASGATGAK
jgi:PPIC-type peptidyl-prolyl cis-trans isomerase-like protein